MEKVDLEIRCPDIFEDFPRCIHGNNETISHIRPRPLPVVSIPIRHSTLYSLSS